MSEPHLVRAVLVLPVRDLRQARAWYAEALDFETVYLNRDADDPEGNYAVLRRDGAEVHLFLDEPPREHPWTTAGTGYLYLLVRDVEGVYEQVASRGVAVRRELATEDWGARGFQLTDPSGNLILVAEEMAS